MQKTDDIDLLFTLHEHGWSTCWIYVNNTMHELTISHVFGDPIGDWIFALKKLINGEDRATFYWYGEPGGERIQINRIKDRKHIIQIQIDGFHESFGDEIKDFAKTVEFEIKEKAFITICYLQLKKIELLLTEKSFLKHRNGEFPHKDFKELSDLVEEYLK